MQKAHIANYLYLNLHNALSCASDAVMISSTVTLKPYMWSNYTKLAFGSIQVIFSLYGIKVTLLMGTLFMYNLLFVHALLWFSLHTLLHSAVLRHFRPMGNGYCKTRGIIRMGIVRLINCFMSSPSHPLACRGPSAAGPKAFVFNHHWSYFLLIPGTH